jgi:hypothetical protein
MRESLWLVRVPALAVVFYFSLCFSLGSGQTLEWQRQFGSPSEDRGRALTIDPWGNVILLATAGDLPDAPSLPPFSVLRKLDPHGQTVWTTRIENTSGNRPGLASDASGNIYITDTLGWTITKIDSQGDSVWTQPVPGDRLFYSVSASTPGSLYVLSDTMESVAGPLAGGSDYLVQKLDLDGNEQWIRQFGGDMIEQARSVASDLAGNVYVAGITTGGPTGDDGFVAKIDPNGNQLWARQIASDLRDVLTGVVVDGDGNVYVGGSTEGDLGDSGPLGGRDGLLVKFDGAGNLQWTRQFGTNTFDDTFGLAIDSSGDVYVSGETMGSLGGPAAGQVDLFVSKFDPSGDVVWHYQTGTSMADSAVDVQVDARGNIYYTGFSRGSLGGDNSGTYDIIVGKIAVPEPATVLLAGLAAVGFVSEWRRRRGS